MRIIISHSVRLLVVTGRSRHASRHCSHLLSAYCVRCCLRSWITIHLNHWRLRLCRGLGRLRTLSWRVPSEAKHVCQIFSELSRSWKASCSNDTFTRFNAWNSCRATSGINEHTLRWVQTLLSVLSKHRWMWRRASRDHTCIWNSSKMICLCWVHYKWGCFGGWQTDSICTLTRRLLFLVAIDETLVAVRITTWCWTNTTSRVLRFCILLSISKNSLQKRSPVLLTLPVGLLEANGPIWWVEAFVCAVWTRAIPSRVRSSLHFHVSSV